MATKVRAVSCNVVRKNNPASKKSKCGCPKKNPSKSGMDRYDVIPPKKVPFVVHEPVDTTPEIEVVLAFARVQPAGTIVIVNRTKAYKTSKFHGLPAIAPVKSFKRALARTNPISETLKKAAKATGKKVAEKGKEYGSRAAAATKKAAKAAGRKAVEKGKEYGARAGAATKRVAKKAAAKGAEVGKRAAKRTARKVAGTARGAAAGIVKGWKENPSTTSIAPMTLGKFTFDVPGSVFPGYTDGMTWNGWAVAHVTTGQVLHLNEAMRKLGGSADLRNNDLNIKDNEGHVDTIKPTKIRLGKKMTRAYSLEGYTLTQVKEVPTKVTDRVRTLETRAMKLFEQSEQDNDVYCREAEEILEQAQFLLDPYGMTLDQVDPPIGNPITAAKRKSMNRSLFALPAMRKYRLDSPARCKYTLTLLNQHYKNKARTKKEYETAYVNIMVAYMKNGQVSVRAPMVKTPLTLAAFKAASPLKNPAQPVSHAQYVKALEILARNCKTLEKAGQMTKERCAFVQKHLANVKKGRKSNPTKSTYRISADVGPTTVKHFANKLRDAGFRDVIEGTATVYGAIEAEDHVRAQILAQDALGFRGNVWAWKPKANPTPASNKVLAYSFQRYNGGVKIKRRWGSSTVTRFYVMWEKDKNNAGAWDIIEGYGKTPGERKTFAMNAFREKHAKENPVQDVRLPSEEDGGKPSHDKDFAAGFAAGKKALKTNANLSVHDAKSAFSKVKGHGSWWTDGFIAAIDLHRGAHKHKGVQIAKRMGLVSTLKQNPTSKKPAAGKKKYRLLLAHAPNWDISGDGYDGYWSHMSRPAPKFVEVNSFGEASKKVEEYIKKYELGGGNWTYVNRDLYSGIILEGKKKVAHVSYNGRVWKYTGKMWDPDAKVLYEPNPVKLNPSKDQIHLSYHNKRWYVLFGQDWLWVTDSKAKELLSNGAMKVPWSHGKLAHHAPGKLVEDRALGLMMHNWHSGQGDSIYGVGSLLFAGQKPTVEAMQDALSNIQYTIHNKNAKFNNADYKELKLIENNLAERISRAQGRKVVLGNPTGKPVNATELNVSTMEEALVTGGGLIRQVRATDAPHIRRCIKAGLLEPGPERGTWRVTAAGAARIEKLPAVYRYKPKVPRSQLAEVIPFPKRNPTKKPAGGIPKVQIEYIVGNIHVGEPDEVVRKNIEDRARKAGGTAKQIKACGDYAVKVHQRNRNLYNDVISGRIGSGRRRNPVEAGLTASTKIPAIQITLTRTEGGNHDLNEPHHVTGKDVWGKANALLSLWGAEAAVGARNKVKFTVHYADKETYTGSYHVSSADKDSAHLGQHIRHSIEAVLGKRKPTHMTQEQYQLKLAQVKIGMKEKWEVFLSKYSTGKD